MERPVVLGACSFTYRVVTGLLECGVRPRCVVVLESTRHGPFEPLRLDPKPGWLRRHDWYWGGWRQDMIETAAANDIPLIRTTDPLASLPADAKILVVGGYPDKIPSDVMARFGPWALNIHPSMLPEFRGPEPEAQAILAGAGEMGVSVHTMTEKFDSGPVHVQSAFSVDPTDEIDTLELLGARLGAHALAALLATPDRIACGRPRTGGRYFRAYDRSTLLDLRRATDGVDAVRKLRLRPDGWAFYRIDDATAYPIVANLEPCERSLRLGVGADILFAHAWVIAPDRGGMEFQQCGCAAAA